MGAPRNIKYHQNVYHIIAANTHHESISGGRRRREALTLTAMWRGTENGERSQRTDKWSPLTADQPGNSPVHRHRVGSWWASGLGRGRGLLMGTWLLWGDENVLELVNVGLLQ